MPSQLWLQYVPVDHVVHAQLMLLLLSFGNHLLPSALRTGKARMVTGRPRIIPIARIARRLHRSRQTKRADSSSPTRSENHAFDWSATGRLWRKGAECVRPRTSDAEQLPRSRRGDGIAIILPDLFCSYGMGNASLLPDTVLFGGVRKIAPSCEEIVTRW